MYVLIFHFQLAISPTQQIHLQPSFSSTQVNLSRIHKGNQSFNFANISHAFLHLLCLRRMLTPSLFRSQIFNYILPCLFNKHIIHRQNQQWQITALKSSISQSISDQKSKNQESSQQNYSASSTHNIHVHQQTVHLNTSLATNNFKEDVL